MEEIDNIQMLYKALFVKSAQKPSTVRGGGGHCMTFYVDGWLCRI
jgi:hypothetical protein